MTKIIIVLALLAISTVMTIAAPEVFGKNDFLKAFITFELLNILAVILTVTLASVANIHLSLNKIVRLAFKNKTKGLEKSKAVRREINQNGWLLLILFVAAIVLLLVKGWSENVTILSLVHSYGLVILILNVIVLYDIYKVVYALIILEETLPDISLREK